MGRGRRIALYVLAGAAGATLAVLPWEPATAQDEGVSGRRLYAAHCASCHGNQGRGGEYGPSLIGVGAASVDFYLSTGRMPLADPDRQAARKEPFFSPPLIDALVDYVTSLSPPGAGPPIPEVRPDAGDVSHGFELYARHCLACHAPAAHGASVGGGQVAPGLAPATPVEIAEAVRIGPGAMPRFGEGVIDQREMDDLVRYVLSLRDEPTRGGIGTGAIGTVVEGFIGWLFGMGVLLIVLRLTGASR